MEFPRFTKKELHYILKYQLDGDRGIRSKNQDRVVCIMGNEGVGKSHLALWMFTSWFEEVMKIDLTQEVFLKHFCAENEKFNDAIHKSDKYTMNVHDEAILLTNSRRAMSKTNVDNNEKYMIIRGLNLYSIFNIPSILDMDSNFRNRRVKVMFYVKDFGEAYGYGRNKLNKLIPAMNKAKIYNSNPDPLRMKDEFGTYIVPDFQITYPEYKGKFRDIYEDMKNTSMKTRLDDSGDIRGSNESKLSESDKLMKDLYKIHGKYSEVAKIMGKPESTVRGRVKKLINDENRATALGDT